MSVLELVAHLESKAAHYRRHMWLDVIFCGLFAILTLASGLLGADVWLTSITASWSATMLGRASIWGRSARDLRDIVWYYTTKLAIGGMIARDVQ